MWDRELRQLIMENIITSQGNGLEIEINGTMAGHFVITGTLRIAVRLNRR